MNNQVLITDPYMHIAIFGSAFNPPTLGHADAIEFLLEKQQFQEIWLVPSYKHAFAKDMLDYDIRVAMLDAFVSDLQIPAVKTHAIEHLIAQDDNPVYTWDLLSYLQQQHSKSMQFSFAIGPDNKANWHKFYKAQEIQQQWELVTVPERKTIRSTLVRNALQTGGSVDELISPSVRDFIYSQRLFQTP